MSKKMNLQKSIFFRFGKSLGTSPCSILAILTSQSGPQDVIFGVIRSRCFLIAFSKHFVQKYWNFQKWKSSSRYVNNSVSWGSPWWTTWQKTWQKTAKKTWMFVSKIERKLMKTVAAVTLAAKIDKSAASVPQSSSNMRFFIDFGIPRAPPK